MDVDRPRRRREADPIVLGQTIVRHAEQAMVLAARVGSIEAIVWVEGLKSAGVGETEAIHLSGLFTAAATEFE